MGCFSSKECKNNVENYYGDEQLTSKVFPSDYDRGYWVGEPRIDNKASVFINEFHLKARAQAQFSNNGRSFNNS